MPSILFFKGPRIPSNGPASTPLLPVSWSHGSHSLQKKTANTFSVCSLRQPRQGLPSAARLGVSPVTSAAGPLYGWPSTKEGVTSAWPHPPAGLDPTARTFLNIRQETVAESPRPAWGLGLSSALWPTHWTKAVVTLASLFWLWYQE